MNRLTIINEIYVMLNAIVEVDIKLDFDNYKNMIKKMFLNDKTYMDHCPCEFKNEAASLKKLIDSNSEKELLFKEVIKFINAFSEVLTYENCSSNINTLEKDKLYYKAVLNNYYIEDYLINHKNSKFAKFKSEFYEIGVLISKFYNSSSEVITKIIYSKVEELFERYNFIYTLPECCKKVV